MAAAKNNKILIVDDEPLNRLFLVDLLKMHNLDPSEAVNGKEAIQHWLTTDYFVILMDIHMPEMNGIDATRLIRQKEQEEGLAKTPIIAVTAFATQETKDDCQQVGMDDFLPKPVKISEIMEIVEKFL